MEHETIIKGSVKCKKQFNTYKEADLNAKRYNIQDINFNKKRLMAYKCNVCYKFHVGSSLKNINEFYVNKTKIELYLNLSEKIVSTIDLDKIDPKKMNYIKNNKP